MRRVLACLEGCGGDVAGVGEGVERPGGGGGGLGRHGERLGGRVLAGDIWRALCTGMPGVITFKDMPTPALGHISRTTEPNRARFVLLCAKLKMQQLS